MIVIFQLGLLNENTAAHSSQYVVDVLGFRRENVTQRFETKLPNLYLIVVLSKTSLLDLAIKQVQNRPNR